MEKFTLKTLSDEIDKVKLKYISNDYWIEEINYLLEEYENIILQNIEIDDTENNNNFLQESTPIKINTILNIKKDINTIYASELLCLNFEEIIKNEEWYEIFKNLCNEYNIHENIEDIIKRCDKNNILKKLDKSSPIKKLTYFLKNNYEFFSAVQLTLEENNIDISRN